MAWLLTKVAAPIVGATKLHHIEGAAKAVELTLTPEETAYLEEPYVPHKLAGVMAQNTPAAAKQQHVWSTGSQKIETSKTKNRRNITMAEIKEMPKIALGAWAWGNDGTFGGNLTPEALRPVFDAAMKNGLISGTLRTHTVWELLKGSGGLSCESPKRQLSDL